MTEKKKQEFPKITIGMDPELVILDRANKPMFLRELIRSEDAFGVDGHTGTDNGYIAELRPPPAESPRKFVQQMRDVLITGLPKLARFKWQAGPFVSGKPLGGHIHFGVPSYKDKHGDALDGMLSILLALSEPPEAARQRRTTIFFGNTPYGLLGDIRKKPKYGFEYRTPSSFIVNPGVSLGILSAAKAIVMEEEISGQHAWSKLSPTDRKSLLFKPEDFYLSKRETFLLRLPELWKHLKQMKYFTSCPEGKELWSSLSYLRKTAMARNGFSADRDIKGNWKLPLGEFAKDPKEKSFLLPEEIWDLELQPAEILGIDRPAIRFFTDAEATGQIFGQQNLTITNGDLRLVATGTAGTVTGRTVQNEWMEQPEMDRDVARMPPPRDLPPRAPTRARVTATQPPRIRARPFIRPEMTFEDNGEE